MGTVQCHLEFVVVWRTLRGGCEGGSSGQSGEKDIGVVHFGYCSGRAGGREDFCDRSEDWKFV